MPCTVLAQPLCTVTSIMTTFQLKWAQRDKAAGPASLWGERIMTALCPEPAPRDTGCGCGCRDLLARAPPAGSPRRSAGRGVCACMHVRMHVRAHVRMHVYVCVCVCECLHIVGAQFKGAVGIASSHFLNKTHPSAWKAEGEEGPLPVAQGPGPQLVAMAGPALLFPPGLLLWGV